ncbi:ankyrin unc44 [Fusarium tjaetaba]|uniref:Ankyrin unc44 n=1 Tax=Fusarium tjaetaba TaxID=1567544 RepID=A0A8H5W1J2_9HYPO|nr:ankyrin unc44 [Fusarium tjaetaba]KAF5641479.1 ankyrin unc44 [Fusarium tjaetaba]
MAETILAIMADNDGGLDKDFPVPEDPGDEVARHPDSDSSSTDEGDESDKPKPLPLHEKLLEIAEAEEESKAALSAEFNFLLVESRSEINTRDSTDATALHVAIEHGLEAEAQKLIENGADTGMSDSDGKQVLHLACRGGLTELVTFLLGQSPNVNTTSKNGDTPLAAACRNGHANIVNLLLDMKANVKTADEEMWTPLHWASWENHVEIVKRLLDEDTDIDATEGNENWTPLNAAAYRGHEEVVSLLLRKSADLSIPDSSNWTPLMTATRMQHPEIARTILRYKESSKKDFLEIRDDGNNTPLSVASYYGYNDIASQLIDAGADCNATDNDGMTPLHSASFQNHYQITTLLLSKASEFGIDIEAKAKAKNGRTPLHLASLQGNELIVKTLLQAKASIDATDDSKLTPLHLASGAKSEDRCDSEHDPVLPGPSGENDTDWEKRNAEAMSGRHLAVVELLLKNKASPCLKAANGDTALHRAAATGDKERIDILMKHMKLEDFSWKNWKDSPVQSALRGSDPQAAMEALLGEEKVKTAAFWKDGGRINVIKEAMKASEPQHIVGQIFCQIAANDDTAPEGSNNWSPIRWAAHERLPDVLSQLIDESGPSGDVGKMVHEALQETSKSITLKELESEPSCEKLVQVLWILITTSERVPLNTQAIRDASRFVREKTSPSKPVDMEVLRSLSALLRVRLSKLDDLKAPNDSILRNKKFSLNKDAMYWSKQGMYDGVLSETKALETRFAKYAEFSDTLQTMESHLSKYAEYYSREKLKSITMLSTLQDILKDPPFAQISQTHRDEVDYKPPVPEASHEKVVQQAEATVVGFFKREGESGRIRRNRPIQEVVYDPGPTNVVGAAIRSLIDMTKRGSMRFNSKLYAKENLKLTWVHLPSTNDLLTSIMSYEQYRARELYEVRSFFRDSWVEVPDKESRLRMMRPRSVIRPIETAPKLRSDEGATSESLKDYGEGKGEAHRAESGAGGEDAGDTPKFKAAVADSTVDEQRIYKDWASKPHLPEKKPHQFVHASAVYMPYLSYSTHCRHWNNGNRELKEAHDHYEELQEKYKDKDKPQHGSPTLDEWYYQFAQSDPDATEDQESRNENQVVSKYLKQVKEADDTTDSRDTIDLDENQWTVVRVNQLWIWTIAKDWIITATSTPFDNSPDVLVEDILNQLSKQAEYGGSRAQPVSAADLVPVIVDHCIGSYERRPLDNQRISIGQTFSHYINRIETNLFEGFRVWSLDENRRKNTNNKAYRRSPAENLLQYAKDRKVEEAPSSSRDDTAGTKQTSLQPHSRDISAQIEKATELYCEIKDVRDEVNILKSVAQFQQIVQRGLAGKDVDESRFSSTYVVKDLKELDSIAERIQGAISTTLSLQQSDVANRQATEATRQGKTVMTFTFATVLFLPLSFLSSLFALDVASFQQAPAWAFYVIFFVSIGISVILGCSVFWWDNIKRAKDILLDILENSFESASRTSSPPKLPGKEGTASKDREGIDTAVDIRSKSKDSEPGFKKRFRRQRRGGDEETAESHAVT